MSQRYNFALSEEQPMWWCENFKAGIFRVRHGVRIRRARRAVKVQTAVSIVPFRAAGKVAPKLAPQRMHPEVYGASGIKPFITDLS